MNRDNLTEDLRVRVDTSTRASLERIAERDRRSVAYIIRRFIERGIAAEDQEGTANHVHNG